MINGITENIDFDKILSNNQRDMDTLDMAEDETDERVVQLSKRFGHGFIQFFMKYIYRGFSKN